MGEIEKAAGRIEVEGHWENCCSVLVGNHNELCEQFSLAELEIISVAFGNLKREWYCIFINMCSKAGLKLVFALTSGVLNFARIILKLLWQCKNDLLKRSNSMELPGKLTTFYSH